MSTHAPAGSAQHVAETVTAAARAMYPHAGLSDRVYGRVAVKLTEGAAGEPEAERVLAEGIAQLDAGAAPFVDLDAAAKLDVLRQIEGSKFFELVRGTAVVEVYSDPETWELLGYEGPSFAKGGYLERGFNDLDWLPDPDPTFFADEEWLPERDEPEAPARPQAPSAFFADEEWLPDPKDRR
jgi:hypothetical protein